MNRRIALLLLIILPAFFSCTEKEQEIRVESVTISMPSAELEIGRTLELSATVTPTGATNKDITWSSSNSSVASVSAAGLVTALSEGTTTITASADGKKGECKVSVVKVPIAVTEVKLDKTELTLYEGEEETLTTTVLPDDATDKTVSWTSSDNSIATVESGKVKAIGKGTAKITATAGGNSASCDIEVFRPVSGISLNKTTLELPLEKSETLTATIIPADATPRGEITWSSSNTEVATVDAGTVTALSMGSTTITASLEGFKAECAVTVKGMEYGEIAITDLKPVEIMPVIGQVTEGDKQVYDHIEHLRLAEATRIRDMMWEYGAGSHSMAEYQQLMGRLVVGMEEECPSITESFEVVGRGFNDLATWENSHSHREWSILNSIVPNTRRIVSINAYYDEKRDMLTEKPDQIDWINMSSFMAANPNAIVIVGRSAYAEWYGNELSERGKKEVFEGEYANEVYRLCREGRLMIFRSGGNIHEHYGVLINKCFNKEVDGDEHGIYSFQSLANGKNDANADMALLVTIGTNDKGDIDQTDEIYESSLFPVGFHDKVLFAGRAFPGHNLNEGVYSGEGGLSNNGKYATSFTNYVNTAMMGVCFQMYAEAKDVFELLDMVRSTCLTDYIRLDGQTQPLQLINPAGLYKKYLTPQNLPTTISSGETVNLDKGYYKGVLFCIPGAEVMINGEWIAFDNKNKEVIVSQNPMNLEWRLNGNLIKKYGYAPGQTVEGQIITVDDKWGGLRLEVPMTVQVR
jgi:uncharacterized protein YjdB